MLCDALNIARMRMANRNDRMTTIQIKVSDASCVVDIAAFTSGDLYRKEWIYIE
ncbi:hypothetical protein MARINOS108_90093 [Marinoscillum sp. 108]|nr:hypothetical protein MARINOS108_90093 [Marinoscillum sp. 108]